VLTGTILHGTRVPVRTWIRVVAEACASPDGLTARDIERRYGVTAKTASAMVLRLRDAMRQEPMASLLVESIRRDAFYLGASTGPEPRVPPATEARSADGPASGEPLG